MIPGHIALTETVGIIQVMSNFLKADDKDPSNQPFHLQKWLVLAATV